MTDKFNLSNFTYQIAASPNIQNDGVCFAALGSGLYRSNDAGQSWENVFENLGMRINYPAINVAVSHNFSEDNFVIAATPGGFFISSDRGNSWMSSKLEFSDTLVSSLVISHNFEKEGMIFAGTVEDGFLRSINGGSSWTYWNFGLLDPNILCLSQAPDFEEKQLLIIGCETNLYKSLSAGRSWIPCRYDLAFQDISSIAFSPHYKDDKTIVVGTLNGEVFVSIDQGITWDCLTNQLLGQQIIKIELLKLGDEAFQFFFVTSQAIYLVKELKNNWLRIPNPGNGEITCALAPLTYEQGHIVFIGTSDKGVVLYSIQNS